MVDKMTQLITVDRATLEQALAALNDTTGLPSTGARSFDNRIMSIRALRTALANAEPIARMQPVTKARVGNYLNKHPMGDLTAYRHGFKDGVKWREQL